MGKGSDRRPQLVSDETFSENWDIAFGKKRFMCSLCGWTGDDPIIVGVDYPFANVCPDCGCAVIDYNAEFDAAMKNTIYGQARQLRDECAKMLEAVIERIRRKA